RVILVGIFVFASLLGAVVVLSEIHIFAALSPVIVGIGLGILLVCLCAGALMFLNRGYTAASGLKPRRSRSELWRSRVPLSRQTFGQCGRSRSKNTKTKGVTTSSSSPTARYST